MNHWCEFCNQECKYVSQNVDERVYGLPLWYTCETCNTGYEKSLKGNLIKTRFYTRLNGKNYSLDLLHFFKEVRVLQLPEDVEEPIIIVLSIKNIDSNITPHNCQSKIETYITFS